MDGAGDPVGDPAGGADDPAATARARAAETKRARSRERLVAAAGELFAERGWHGTRVEDIAARAGVSVATAYNHFDSKVALVAEIFGPPVGELDRRLQADLAAGTPVLVVLRRCVAGYVDIMRRHTAIGPGLVAMALETRLGRRRGATDARPQVDFPSPLTEIARLGQERGELRGDPPAVEVAAMVASALLFRVITRPQEPPQVTVDLAMAIVERTLAP